ncbi:uncharacterized protein EAF02_008598 [Botrytis sinoallii]|uniref:uncharacterized protein n=1 Tax=Botrytis sinoallii TaxID=1463999 RepID=UPI001900E3C9|nr:uncharacterized protein EAF02_008598 [Botrytis sinoallii]KAF7874621.1 hypothetical protein EAF02_008598 [Botrytis sinoallii]
MPQYNYSTNPLDSDSIRLLALMPSKDQTARIQCQLHNYSLRESDRGIHLYEALSYVWGSPDKPKVVLINENSLPVTTNLYTALLHLRDRTFERIIWVDSICINQKDDTEKSQQIQLMAKIFGQANRVIVFLGEAADDSNQALECIRFAAEGESSRDESPEGEFSDDEFSEDESLDQGINEVNQRGIFELLERPWFRRIWVLQEVGFAQQILIMCGSATIDGYTFSTGFSQLFYNRHSDLLDLIRPVIYLIRGAIFRPKYEIRSSGALSLGSLVDMYHTRMATNRHDKVYALLSMSSDSPNLAGLSPDYKITWSALLKRLVQFVLSKKVFVKTWESKEMVLIESKGYVLGHVISIDVDSTRYERQCINIKLNSQPKSVHYDKKYSTRWFLQASAKSIRQGDLVCLLQGALKPSIIRAYKDHFTIIVIAVTLQEHTRKKRGHVKSRHTLASRQESPRDFLLIWNWEQVPDNFQSQEEYEGTIERYTSIPEYLKTDTHRALNSINVAVALADTKNYEYAKDILQRQIKNYEGKLGRESLHILALKESLAWMYYHQGDVMKAEPFFMQVIQIRKSLQGEDHRDTLRSIAKLGLVYMKEQGWSMERRHMITILSKIEKNIQMSEEDMIEVGKSSNQKMMKLVLDQEKKNLKITEDVMEAVVGNHDSGYEVMELLLAQGKENVKVTENLVKAVAKNGQNGYEIMKLLFEKRGEEITITTQILNDVVDNEANGYQIMKLLLENGYKEISITQEIVKIALENPSCGYEIIMLLFEKRGKEITITEDLVTAVAGSRWSGYKIMEFFLEKRGGETIITDKVIKAAAGNWGHGYDVWKRLCQKRGEETIIIDEMVKTAVGNWSDGYKILKLLFQKRSKETIITDEVVKIAVSNWGNGYEILKLLFQEREAVAKNGFSGQEIMIILLEERGGEVTIPEKVVVIIAGKFGKKAVELMLEKQREKVVITEEVMKAAAGNPHYGKEVIKFLLQKRGEEIIITEQILEVAERRSRLTEEVMELLLKHQATNVMIPEKTIKGAITDE